MDKSRLYHVWKKIRPWHPWWFLLAAAFCLLLCLYGLRANNLEMVRLRNEVYRVDREGGDVQKALTELQRYVTSHMNTNLSGGPNAVYPPIQLKYTYERLQAANGRNASNEQVYVDAQAHCERLNPTDFSGRNRVPCIAEYVRNNGVQPVPISDSLYKFDFLSPRWSPDLAGFGSIGVVLFGLAALVLWLVRRWLQRQLNL